MILKLQVCYSTKLQNGKQSNPSCSETYFLDLTVNRKQAINRTDINNLLIKICAMEHNYICLLEAKTSVQITSISTHATHTAHDQLMPRIYSSINRQYFSCFCSDIAPFLYYHVGQCLI